MRTKNHICVGSKIIARQIRSTFLLCPNDFWLYSIACPPCSCTASRKKTYVCEKSHFCSVKNIFRNKKCKKGDAKVFGVHRNVRAGIAERKVCWQFPIGCSNTSSNLSYLGQLISATVRQRSNFPKLLSFGQAFARRVQKTYAFVQQSLTFLTQEVSTVSALRI